MYILWLLNQLNVHNQMNFFPIWTRTHVYFYSTSIQITNKLYTHTNKSHLRLSAFLRVTTDPNLMTKLLPEPANLYILYLHVQLCLPARQKKINYLTFPFSFVYYLKSILHWLTHFNVSTWIGTDDVIQWISNQYLVCE